MTRTEIDGVTFDRQGGALPILILPSFGETHNEIAAKIIDDENTPLAVILYPLARWNMSLGHWARMEEHRFQDAARKVAAHVGGTLVLRHDPL